MPRPKGSSNKKAEASAKSETPVLEAELVPPKPDALAVRPATEDAIDIPVKSLGDRLKSIKEFQTLVQESLKKGHDYGVIEGCGDKPALLKPGAEKIAKLLGLADTYEILDKTENWTVGSALFHYTIKCKLIGINSGALVSEGVGSCSSMESKYRWRKGERVCPKCGKAAIIKGKDEFGGGWLCFKKKDGCGAKFPDNAPEIKSQQAGRVENPDIYDQVNTILKMAKKRALVDAALSVGRLSDLFTQDIDEMKDGEPEGPAKQKAKAQEQASSKPSAPRSSSKPPEQEEMPDEPPPDEEGDDPIGDGYAGPPPEAEAKDPEKEKLIASIKKKVEQASFDYKDFKKFLMRVQDQDNIKRKFVGLNWGKPSLSAGDIKDLKMLDIHFSWAKDQYLKAKGK